MTVPTELCETIAPAVAFTTVLRTAETPVARRASLTWVSLMWMPAVRNVPLVCAFT